jgi:hypothetical protein
MIPVTIKDFNFKEEPPTCFKDCKSGGECSYPICGLGAVHEALRNDQRDGMHHENHSAIQSVRQGRGT